MPTGSGVFDHGELVSVGRTPPAGGDRGRAAAAVDVIWVRLFA